MSKMDSPELGTGGLHMYISFSCLNRLLPFLMDPGAMHFLQTFLVSCEPRKTYTLWVSLNNLPPVLSPMRLLSKESSVRGLSQSP